MGREARVKKDRTCRKCGKVFMNLMPAQIAMHAYVCEFEQTTGIEVITMKPEVEVVRGGNDEPLIVIP